MAALTRVSSPAPRGSHGTGLRRRAPWPQLALLALASTGSPAEADCLPLEYRLADAVEESARVALARGLAAHLDWLHAHGVHFAQPAAEAPGARAATVCLGFTASPALLHDVVEPLLAAFAAPARLTATTAANAPGTGMAHGSIVLAPTDSLAELIEGLAARGLRLPSTPAGARPP